MRVLKHVFQENKIQAKHNFTMLIASLSRVLHVNDHDPLNPVSFCYKGAVATCQSFPSFIYIFVLTRKEEVIRP